MATVVAVVAPPDSPLLATHLPGRGRVLQLRGDIDHGDLDRLDGVLGRHVEGGGGVVELSDVTLLPAAAVGALLRHVLSASRARLELRLVAAPASLASRVLGATSVPHHPCC